MKIIGVIPARYDSKRFPGKVLMRLHGRTILQYVWEQAIKSDVLDDVFIATDDIRIQEAAIGFNAPVIMTGKECASGSDRIAEVVKDMDCGIVINIQADQPQFPQEILRELVEPLLEDSKLQAATPVYKLNNPDLINNPNIVKAVIDKSGFAIYFSRLPIPYIKNGSSADSCFYKHIGIYAYRKEFLLKYAGLLPGPLEKAEGLEQLRIIEYGYHIKTVLTSYNSISIDTKEDLAIIG